MGGRASWGGRGGFTLVEVLVALLVVSVTVVAALGLAGGGLRLVAGADEHARAALLATAKLSETGDGPPPEGTIDGTEGDYRWTRRVTLEPELLPLPATHPGAASLRIARVSVEVRWGRGRRVELVTLRTFRAAP